MSAYTNIPGELRIKGKAINPPSGTVLSGTYEGSVYCDGNLSLGANTTISGDLILTGNLTNSGGYSLSVGGNLYCNSFNFTPASLVTPQGDLTVNGNMTVIADSEFLVNPGQSPKMFVFGSLRNSADPSSGAGDYGNGVAWPHINAYGQPTANGLTIQISGDVVAFEWIDISGGDSDGVSPAGNGGYLAVNGAMSYADVYADGGDSAFNGFGGGEGGKYYTEGLTGTWGGPGLISLKGGSTTSSTVGDGGNGGIFASAGTLLLFQEVQGMDISGGDANAGNGGNGGAGGFYGNGEIIGNFSTIKLNGGNSTLGNGGNGGDWHVASTVSNGLTLEIKGGNGGTNGGNGAVLKSRRTEFTSSDFDKIDLSGGDGGTGVGGNGGSIEINGDLNVNGEIDLSGGNGGTDGGSSGNLDVRGSLTLSQSVYTGQLGRIYMHGGNGTSGNGGNGGSISVGANVNVWDEIHLQGGNGGAAGTGGTGGNITNFGSMTVYTINAKGGNAGTGGEGGWANLVNAHTYSCDFSGGDGSAGNGGSCGGAPASGGEVTFVNWNGFTYGSITCNGGSGTGVAGSCGGISLVDSLVQDTVSMLDGASGSAPSTTRRLTVAGHVSLNVVSVQDRADVMITGNGGNWPDAVLTMSSMTDKKTLRNTGGESADVSGMLADSVFKAHKTGTFDTTWYRIQGTTV